MRRQGRDPYNWSSDPPAGSGRAMLRIVKAPKEGTIDLVVLSPHIVGIWTHWVGDRTIGCTNGFGCKCEVTELPTRWKGYLACAQVTDGKVVLAELTGDATRNLMLQDNLLSGPPLRGLVLRLGRVRGSRVGRVVAGIVTGKRFDDAALPKPPDVQQELQRIWCSRR